MSKSQKPRNQCPECRSTRFVVLYGSALRCRDCKAEFLIVAPLTGHLDDPDELKEFDDLYSAEHEQTMAEIWDEFLSDQPELRAYFDATEDNDPSPGPGNVHGDPSRHAPGLDLHNVGGPRCPDHGSRALDRRRALDHPRVHDPRVLATLCQTAVAAVVLREGFARPGLVRSWRSSRTREHSTPSIIYACTFPLP